MLLYFLCLVFLLWSAIHFHPRVQKYYNKLLVAEVVLMGLICGLRDMLGGYDNYIYGDIFDSTVDDIAMRIPMWKTCAFWIVNQEYAYSMLNWLLAHVTHNRYIFFLIVSIIIFSSFYYHITKLCEYPLISFFVLICLIYFFSFTYLRQILAVCTTWFAIPFAFNRKPLHFFSIVALAFLFHNSAILFAPVYFVININLTKQQIIYIFIVCFLAGLSPLGSFLMSTLGTEINSAKAQSDTRYDGGARIEYFLEAVFFLYLILSQFKNLLRDKKNNAMLNIAVIFCAFLLMFIRFSDGGRMSWYFMIGVISIVPQVCASNKKNNYAKPLSYIVLSLLYIRIVISWGILLSPYKTFLTNGVRENDIIYEKYEYDQKYADNKMYRAPWALWKNK